MKSSRKKRRKRKVSKSLSRRVKQQFPKQKLVMGQAHDGVKMSEVLKEFVAPYRELVDTEEAFCQLLMTAIVAWNTALFSAQERKACIEKVLKILPEQVRTDGRAIINELIERKERYFSEYKRMIIDYEVTDIGKDYHLVVISTADELVER